MSIFTIIYLRGLALTEEAKTLLETLGTVQIMAQEPIEVIPAPPPVNASDKYHEHRRGNFGARNFEKLLNSGTTLVNDVQGKMLIRIHKNIVHIYKHGKYASMTLKDFLEAFHTRPTQRVGGAIAGMLIRAEEKRYGKLRFIQEPYTISKQVAQELMNWDGNNPDTDPTQVQNPPYFYNPKGKFGAMHFLKLINTNFTIFNDRNMVYVLITGSIATVFVMSSQEANGKFATLDTGALIETLKLTHGSTLRQRLQTILQSLSTRFLERVQTISRDEALKKMQWDQRVQKKGG